DNGLFQLSVVSVVFLLVTLLFKRLLIIKLSCLVEELLVMMAEVIYLLIQSIHVNWSLILQ
uniref:Uncharacterized protein n=1 Tax=Amphimedon queenslandica TaxID=400682 RepID=A0A1X7T4B1_AMPQE